MEGRKEKEGKGAVNQNSELYSAAVKLVRQAGVVCTARCTSGLSSVVARGGEEKRLTRNVCRWSEVVRNGGSSAHYVDIFFHFSNPTRNINSALLRRFYAESSRSNRTIYQKVAIKGSGE